MGLRGKKKKKMMKGGGVSAVVVVVVVVLILMVVRVKEAEAEVEREKVHASVKNRLGNGRSMKVHCESKDNDLGEQVVADGGEFGWDFSANVWGTTLFFCDVEWEQQVRVQKQEDEEEEDDDFHFEFDAYSFERDFVRCQSECSWLVSQEGIYALNNVTGFWEFFYHFV